MVSSLIKTRQPATRAVVTEGEVGRSLCEPFAVKNQGETLVSIVNRPLRAINERFKGFVRRGLRHSSTDLSD